MSILLIIFQLHVEQNLPLQLFKIKEFFGVDRMAQFPIRAHLLILKLKPNARYYQWLIFHQLEFYHLIRNHFR